MKNIKKILLVFVFLLAGAFALAACKKDTTAADLKAAKEALAIGYAQGETFETVVSDVTLPKSLEAYKDLTITWESDAPAVISTEGKVNRQDEDKMVKLTATLKLGKKTDSRVFNLKVLAKESVDADKTLLKGLLDEHYKDSIAQANYQVTEASIEFVAKAGDFNVTWVSNNPAVINVETGVVTKPDYTDGVDATVILKASAEGQNDVIYIVKVAQKEQTLDQKLEAELNRLSTFPSGYYPILKELDLELGKLVDVMVDGEKVATATWTSNDPEYYNDAGVRQEKEFEGEKVISFTVTFTYQEITKTKTVEFTILGVSVFEDFTSMVTGENKASKGDVVKVTNVSFYTETNDGYYLVDKNGMLLFKHGKGGNPAKDKLVDAKFELDIYYGTPQLKNPVYEEVAGTANTPKVTDITLEDLVKKPVPSDDSPLAVQLYKVTGAKLHVFDEADNYKTFLVPQSHNDPTKEPNKSDSMMLYYQTPGGLAKLQALAAGNQTYSKDFDHIVIVVNAFRTNNDIYAFMFLGDINNEADLKITLTPAEQAELALRQAANKIEERIIKEGKNYTLTATEGDYAITYTSDKPEIVGNDGVVLAGQFPAVGTTHAITFTLKTTSTAAEEVTLTKEVKLGRDASITIDAADAKAVDAEVFFEAYYHVGINFTHQFVASGSNLGAAVRFPRGFDDSVLVSGKQYLVYATKAKDYNGLHQFNGIEVIEMDGSDPITAVEYTGDFSKESFAAVMNQVIAYDNLEVKVAPTKDSDGVLTYTLGLAAGTGTMAFREHQSNPDTIAAIEALDLKVGDRVNVKEAIVSWYNNPQFINGVLEKASVDPADLFNESVTRFKLTLPSEDTVYYENFNLPVTFEELAIVWTVTEGDAAATVAADGTVTITKQAERTTVKLSGAITQGTDSATALVQVIIAKEGEVPASETLLRTIDFGDTAKTGYAAGQLTFTNTDGVEDTFTKDRVQINDSKFEPHIAQDQIMVLSTMATAKLAFVEMDFTAITGLSKIVLKASVWNQNNFDLIVGQAGAEVSLEKKVGDTWVKVEDANGKTNILESIVKDQYTEIEFPELEAAVYRLVYNNPVAASTSNTTEAVTIDDIKLYHTP